MACIWARSLINLLLDFSDLPLSTTWTMIRFRVKELQWSTLSEVLNFMLRHIFKKRGSVQPVISYFHCPTLKFTATVLLCQIYQTSPTNEGTSFHHLSKESTWRPSVTMTIIYTVLELKAVQIFLGHFRNSTVYFLRFAWLQVHIPSLTAAGFVPVQFHNLAGPVETLHAVLCDNLFK